MSLNVNGACYSKETKENAYKILGNYDMICGTRKDEADYKKVFKRDNIGNKIATGVSIKAIVLGAIAFVAGVILLAASGGTAFPLAIALLCGGAVGLGAGIGGLKGSLDHSNELKLAQFIYIEKDNKAKADYTPPN